MKGSEFASKFGTLPAKEREARVFDLVEKGSFVRWPWKEVLSTAGPFRGSFFVAADYFAIGEEGDFLRMPISPLLAQRIADRFGWVLPTKKMVDLVWENAEVRAAPSPWGPPYDATMMSLARFEAHDARVTMLLDKLSPGWKGKLVAGTKKDVVLSNRLAKGKVAIYGWHKLDGVPIQGLNPTSHEDTYADYSHGVRFVRGDMRVNDQEMRVLDVLSSPELNALLSDEGILRVTRQPGTTKEERKMEEKVLKRGDKGSGVADWQDFLNAKGFRDPDGRKLATDGDFGPRTEFATKTFQTTHGLGATGQVDAPTLAKAAEINAKPATIPPPPPVPTTPSLDATIKFVQAKNFTKAGRKKVDLVVIHTMEAAEKPNTAENVAAWFAGASAPKASAHYNVDCDSVVQSVKEEDVAWHAPGANHNGIGIEHAGFAKQNAADWSDDFSTRMLVLSAKLVAGICKRWSIPIVKLSPEDVKAGKRGLCGHIDVTNGLNGGKGHWDPGPNFPWARYLDMVRAAS